MVILIIGLVIFLGVHSLRGFAPGWRQSTIDRLGTTGWRAVHSVLALVGLALIIWGFIVANRAPAIVWVPPFGMNHLTILINFFAAIFFAAFFVPAGRLKPAVGHPMVLAVKTWALAHLVSNGTAPEMVLFGAFMVWAIADYAALRRRDRRLGVKRPRGPMTNDAIVVLLGIIIWAAILFRLHQWIIGVSPLV